MTKILFFSGVPINDSATLHRSGLVAKKLIGLGYAVVFTSVALDFKKVKKIMVVDLPVTFLGQAHYWAEKPFSQRKRLSLSRVLLENVKTCRRFSQILRQEKPDRVVMATSMPVCWLAGLISRLMGFRTYLDIEDYAAGQMATTTSQNWLVKLYQLFEKLFIRVFNRLSASSRWLTSRYPSSTYIANMTEVGFWSNRKTINRRKIKAVFIGQVGLYHGQVELLESLAGLLKSSSKLELVFIGGGERVLELRQRIKQLGLAGKAKLVLTDRFNPRLVRKNLADSQIGFLPLWDLPVHQARHPLKLNEYLAAGLVVVTNRVGDTAQIIKDGINGLLCPAGDMACLAEKTELILSKPNLRKQISQAAVKSAKRFDIAQIMPLWLKFLELK